MPVAVDRGRGMQQLRPDGVRGKTRGLQRVPVSTGSSCRESRSRAKLASQMMQEDS